MPDMLPTCCLWVQLDLTPCRLPAASLPIAAREAEINERVVELRVLEKQLQDREQSVVDIESRSIDAEIRLKTIEDTVSGASTVLLRLPFSIALCVFDRSRASRRLFSMPNATCALAKSRSVWVIPSRHPLPIAFLPVLKVDAAEKRLEDSKRKLDDRCVLACCACARCR